MPPLDMYFVEAHGLIFTTKQSKKEKWIKRFEKAKKEFLSLFDNQISRIPGKLMEQGCHIAITNCVAITRFAEKDSVFMQLISPSKNVAMADITIVPSTKGEVVRANDTMENLEDSGLAMFTHALGLSHDTLWIVLQRIGNRNVLPFIHVMLVFMLSMTRHPSVMTILERDFPWYSLAIMLNALLEEYNIRRREGLSRNLVYDRETEERLMQVRRLRKDLSDLLFMDLMDVPPMDQERICGMKRDLQALECLADRHVIRKDITIEAEQFPLPAISNFRPFPEDFALRGLLWSENYFPNNWFTHEKIDEEEKYHEQPFMTEERKERILWLAHRIVQAGTTGQWITYDGTRFSAWVRD